MASLIILGWTVIRIDWLFVLNRIPGLLNVGINFVLALASTEEQ